MSTSFYGTTLARIHQKQYEPLSVRRAPALLRLLRSNGKVRDVLDLACGPGGWAQELVRHRYRVTGVDISRAMILQAKKRVPRARFVCGPMECVRLPACDAITGLGEPFNYLLQPADVQGVFRRAFRALRSGGVLLFDTLEPPRTKAVIHRFRSERLGTVRMFASIVEDPRRRAIERRIALLGSRKGGRRVTVEKHRQRMYGANEMARWLRAAGFRVEIVRSRAVSLSTRHAVLVARKP